jgi:hypothetical protein
MDELIAFQLESNEPYDLKISSPNLQAIHKGRVAREKRVDLFYNTQLNLIGGQLQIALDSLLGQYAVAAINSDLFEPDIILFGAAGVTFRNGFCIGYQFQEELSVQSALATRRTNHRLLMFDHAKLGRIGGWKAEITAKMLLKHTPRCTLISTMPEDPKEREIVTAETNAFKSILRTLKEDQECADKEFELILINKKSEVCQVVSLSEIRANASKAPTTEQPRKVLKPRAAALIHCDEADTPRT